MIIFKAWISLSLSLSQLSVIWHPVGAAGDTVLDLSLPPPDTPSHHYPNSESSHFSPAAIPDSAASPSSGPIPLL